MADASLHGNGEKCPACELRRDPLREAAELDQAVECNFCGGTGRVGRAVAEIIREAVQWAAANYWPEREARWREDNG
ncbi:MAG: hypothetical protein CMP09_05970 [Yangia sp.]|nr:hypothetical protein [Salipiger sp.]